MSKRKTVLPNGLKIEASILPMLSWERCSHDASYTGNIDGYESWNILVSSGCDENRIVALGYQVRDPDGSISIGVWTDEGFFVGENAYEEACEAWNFD